jgi:hypothetical protein
MVSATRRAGPSNRPTGADSDADDAVDEPAGEEINAPLACVSIGVPNESFNQLFSGD